MNNSFVTLLRNENKYGPWTSLDYKLMQICSSEDEDNYDKLIANYNDPQITMALSKIRSNCIEWIPIAKEHSVLIMGSGYGEITKPLAAKAKNVTCLESSYTKCLINEHRVKDCSNVKIYVGTAEDFDKKFKDLKYDYIFMVGCLKEADKYFNNLSSATKEMIQFANKHLHDSGSIVLAEDNKYGIKFFDGTLSDGGGDYFDSITKKSTDTRLYSKNHLIELFNNVNFRLYFYYPFPDYKFAMSIFSEDYLPEKGQLNNYDNTWEKNKLDLFNQGKALENMSVDGVFEDFSNSYLIIAQKSELKKENWPIYIKYSNERNKSFNICTEVFKSSEGKKYIIKRPMSKFAEKHIARIPMYSEEMTKRYAKYDHLHIQKCEVTNDCIKLTYIDGKTCMDTIMEWANNKQDSHIIETFNQLYEYLNVDANSYFIASKQFQDVFGVVNIPKDLKCVANFNNIDLILSNIIVDMTKDWNIIDYEWVFDFPIPMKYILFRSIFYCFKSLGANWNYLRDALYNKFEITDELYDVFINMEKGYQRYILINSAPVRYLKQKGNIKLKRAPAEFFWIIDEDSWSHDRRKNIDAILEPNHKLNFTIKIDPQWKKLRVDPTDKKCIIAIESITDADGNQVPFTTNGKKITSKSYFYNTNDPQIIISQLKDIPRIINMKLQVYELDQSI